MEAGIQTVWIYHIDLLKPCRIHMKEVRDLVDLTLQAEIRLRRTISPHRSRYNRIGIHRIHMKTHIFNLIGLEYLMGHCAGYIQRTGGVSAGIIVELHIYRMDSAVFHESCLNAGNRTVAYTGSEDTLPSGIFKLYRTARHLREHCRHRFHRHLKLAPECASDGRRRHTDPVIREIEYLA